MQFDDEPEHDTSERWLLTYADMITLLLALFIVMFAMSSVNQSKLEAVSKSLQDAFSGKVLTGGNAIKETGGSAQAEALQPAVTQATLQPMGESSPEARAEQTDFRELKAKLDQLIAERRLERKVETAIEKRGLVVRLLTDDLLFASGSATIHPDATPLLGAVGEILASGQAHPVRVEGHTDSVPISGMYPSNWELSGARASSVVRVLLGTPLKASPFEAVGRAQLEPLTTNSTEQGRSKNRRVEIILPRRHDEPTPTTPGEEAAAIRPDHASNAREAHR